MKAEGALTKAIIFIASILATLGMLSLVSGFFDAAIAPYEAGINLGDPSDTVLIPAIPEPTGGTAYDEAPDADAIPEEPYLDDYPFEASGVIEYFSVRMSPSSISRGNLILINRDHGFNPEYVMDLTLVADWQTPSFRVTGNNVLLSESIIEPFIAMMDAFYLASGSNAVSIISGFRGLDRQQELLDEHIARLGAVEAQRWVAAPGHSEHHAGIAMDLGFYHNDVLRTFIGTGTTAWFPQNSYRFGFILRYPENRSNITHVAHEPWHFRYVGLPHAYFIKQRAWVLEEYIEFIMQHDYDNPFIDLFQGYEYEVFFTRKTEIPIPFDSYFDISGNNIDGFIVTLRR
ncbi:MAG: M15 family metallopeptidase [Oscillospiraceae bacterium]|nr:M15 family metallopeptidase [Oscillospiraceae bacterium]